MKLKTPNREPDVILTTKECFWFDEMIKGCICGKCKNKKLTKKEVLARYRDEIFGIYPEDLQDFCDAYERFLNEKQTN